MTLFAKAIAGLFSDVPSRTPAPALLAGALPGDDASPAARAERPSSGTSWRSPSPSTRHDPCAVALASERRTVQSSRAARCTSGGSLDHSVRPDRAGRDRHRLLARHRPRHRRTAGRTWRDGRHLIAQSRRLRRDRGRHQSRARAGSGESRSPPTFRPRRIFSAWSTRRTTPLAGSTFWCATRRQILTTGRWPAFRTNNSARFLENNVLANHWLIQMAAPGMLERNDGSIVIISSIGGLKGSPVIGAYNVSKAADIQLARNLAVEWGKHNVRVNCIAPGLITNRLRPRVVGESADVEGGQREDAARANWRDRRDRGRCRLPRLEGRIVHDRADHRRRRRRDDRWLTADNQALPTRQAMKPTAQINSGMAETAFSAFEAVPGALDCGALIICDHASNAIPPGYGTLGLPPEALESPHRL